MPRCVCGGWCRPEVRATNDGISLATLDIFAGCGGLSEGLAQAGASTSRSPPPPPHAAFPLGSPFPALPCHPAPSQTVYARPSFEIFSECCLRWLEVASISICCPGVGQGNSVGYMRRVVLFHTVFSAMEKG